MTESSRPASAASYGMQLIGACLIRRRISIAADYNVGHEYDARLLPRDVVQARRLAYAVMWCLCVRLYSVRHVREFCRNE